MKIFITGISSGIGKALAKYLLRQGHEVWGIARREPLLQAFSREAGAEKLIWSVCDAGNMKQLQELKKKMAENNFTPQACILNAGISRYDIHSPLNPELCDAMVNANFHSVMNCCYLFSDEIKNQGGQFILISSIFARMPDCRNPAYSASKAAASILFRSLRLNDTFKGIRFKNVYLGPVQTENDREKKLYIPSTDSTARFIACSVLLSGKNDFYYPFSAWLACKLFSAMPEGLFSRLTSPMRRP